MKRKNIITISIICLFLSISVPLYVQKQMYLTAYHNLRNTSIKKNYVFEIYRLTKKNGFTLLHIQTNGYVEGQDTYKIDSYVFELKLYNVCLYKQRTMYDLKDAYYNGIITIEDVKSFHFYHVKHMSKMYDSTTNFNGNDYYQMGDYENPSKYK